MTNLLTRDPNDTGDIPRVDVGETTRRMHPMIATGPFPTIRRSDVTEAQPAFEPRTIGDVTPPVAVTEPTAVLGLIGACRRIDTSDPDEFELVPTVPPMPMPVPPPPPGPQVGQVWENGPAPAYTGRHRRPSRWDWLTVPLAMAWQRNGRAL